MDKKITMVAVVLVVVIIGIGGVLIGRSLVGRGGDADTARMLDEKTRELEEKTRQIQDLEKETAELRQNLEDSAKRVSSIEDRLKTASRAPQGTRDPYPSGPATRTGDGGSYETLRDTSVFEQASTGSRKVATIPRGTKVNVVASMGDWLEVRSKHGKPPGYIRREDARYLGG